MGAEGANCSTMTESLCALLLSTGFRGFIAGRPFPVLRQHSQPEPCSASLPAPATGYVPLPLDLGVKQNSCVKVRRRAAMRECREQRGIAVPFPLLRFTALLES